MGSGGWLWFYNEDKDIVKDISKIHKVNADLVEKHYKKMLEDIKNDTQKQKED
jgi:hypothetical protein